MNASRRVVQVMCKRKTTFDVVDAFAADTGCTGCNATIHDAQKTVGKVAENSIEKAIRCR